MNNSQNSPEAIKALVKEKYANIANAPKDSQVDCGCNCGCANPEEEFVNIMAEDYNTLSGYYDEADLGLGCGLPTEYAQIQAGQTVVDLGSGAGNDCFIARKIVGESGRVIGLDMTSAMIDKAKANAQKLGYQNVEFVLGEIENIPLEADQADVVVSNCVMNLVPNKLKAFQETFRILKSGGHFSISDIVLEGALPPKLAEAAAMYTGCVAGALARSEYLSIVKEAGFGQITIQKEREISLPDDLLLSYIGESGLKEYKESKIGIYSITLFAKKEGN